MKKLALIVCLLSLCVPALALAQGAPKVDVTGTWDTTMEGPEGPMTVLTVFKQDGEKITGTQGGPMGDVKLEGTIVGDDIRFKIEIEMPDGQKGAIAFTGKVTGDSMSGTVEMGGMGASNWSAKKKA